MIRLATEKYYLEGVSEYFFWEELDRITAGQSLNPQLGYNRPLYAKPASVFAGRKTGNQFSVYLYGPVNRFFRTTILCNGLVSAKSHGIMINCSFEYPLWAFVRLMVLLGLVLLGGIRVNAIPITNGLLVYLGGAVLYCLIIIYNLRTTKRELISQLGRIEHKAMTKSKKVVNCKGTP